MLFEGIGPLVMGNLHANIWFVLLVSFFCLVHIHQILFFVITVTFEQVQTLLQPVIDGQNAVAMATAQIRTDMATAEIRRIRRELN